MGGPRSNDGYRCWRASVCSLSRALGQFAQPLVLLVRNCPRRAIPPSACIPVPASWSDLIVARVYACVVGQGGGMDGQETETE